MNEYVLQCQTSVGMPPWEYKTEFASDDAAKGYAQELTRRFAGAPWFCSLLVWRLGDDGELIANYKLGEPPVESLRVLPPW